jgi:integrase
MAGVRNKSRNGKYQGWFVNASGKREYFTGTRKRPETLRMAERLEDEHHQVRLGYRPARSSAAKHQSHLYRQVMDEYLDWGEAQGGRRGKPWGTTHARMRRSHLKWWGEFLGVETLKDIEGILPRVEEALRTLQQQGRAGKTVANYAEAIGAFCDWCVQRGYLAEDPLKAMAPFDTTPLTTRRAMTAEEIDRLLQACAPHRRMLMETAFLSGLRKNELRNLSVDHLDLEPSGLHLDAAWTKNRKSGFQPIPADLAKRLHQWVTSGEPARLYAKFYGREGTTLQAPTHPLLYVPSHTARDLDLDLKAAGIPKTHFRRQGRLSRLPGGLYQFCLGKWCQRQRSPVPCPPCQSGNDHECLRSGPGRPLGSKRRASGRKHDFAGKTCQIRVTPGGGC